MGMSLEAVQCKFASIIEDLSCSPRTLSQFVIWVDLCVAEYKSKGSICLNCSGTKPDPSWLDGLKERLGETVTNIDTLQTDTGEDTRQPRNTDTGTDTRLSLLGSADTARIYVDPKQDKCVGASNITRYSQNSVVRRESSTTPAKSSVRTVDLTRHNKLSQGTVIGAVPKSREITSAGNHSTVDQSVVAAENAGEEVRPEHSVAMDNSREIVCDESVGNVSTQTFSVTENRQNGVFNVGWIQIPSGENGNNEGAVEGSQDVSHANEEEFLEIIPYSAKGRGGMAERSQTRQNSITLQTPMEVSPGTSQQIEGGVSVNSSANCDQGLTRSPVTPPYVSAFTPNFNPVTIKVESESSLCESDFYNNNNTTADVSPGYVMVQIDAPPERPTPRKPRRSSWWSTTDGRPRRPASYIPGPVRKARTNVGNMHRWLREKQDELRHIEEIPPEELDPYLTQFLQMVRRKDGRNYDHNTFKDVRGSIERYLRDHGYPYSIVKSPLFYHSQRAYYDKKEELRHSLPLRKRRVENQMSFLYY